MKNLITSSIPSRSKDSLNLMLQTADKKHVKYLFSVLNNFYCTLRNLTGVPKNTRIAAIILFTKNFKQNVEASSLPGDMLTHLLCFIDTVSKEERRKLQEQYVVYDPETLKVLTDKATTRNRAERIAQSFRYRGNDAVSGSLSAFRKAQYEKTS